jgi:hypothetical protein
MQSLSKKRDRDPPPRRRGDPEGQGAPIVESTRSARPKSCSATGPVPITRPRSLFAASAFR